MNHILFLRNRPRKFNLGDFLCTPLHYFDFGARAHQTRTFLPKSGFKVILGGGAYNDLGVGQDVDKATTVAWGIGSSVHGETSAPTNGDHLPYFLYGLRDIDALEDPTKVLPCVSCLHPFTDVKPGTKLGIFLNFDKGITDSDTLKTIALKFKQEAVFCTNNVGEHDFMKSFGEVGTVITNSFHVAYWSLLSGRSVSIIGYSSKFRSLLKLMGLDPSYILNYKVTDQRDLTNAVEICAKGEYRVQAPDARERLMFCREKNMAFAKKCVESGFTERATLTGQTPHEMKSRALRYWPIQLVAGMKRQR